jgi:hypothetical protein
MNYLVYEQCILQYLQNLMKLFCQAFTSIKWLYVNLHNFWIMFRFYYHYFITRWLVKVRALPTSVTPAFLAPNKSSNKLRVISKIQLSSFAPFRNPGHRPPLSPSVRVPRNPPAPPAFKPAPTRATPSAAVGHRAENPAHAAVPPAGPPRHHRRPENHADARKSKKNPAKPFPQTFLEIFPNF